MYECPACHVAFSAAQWDEATLPNARNRKVRRAYVSIKKGTRDKWYECPGCMEKFSKKNIKEVQCHDARGTTIGN